jgi:hypothetical protein
MPVHSPHTPHTMTNGNRGSNRANKSDRTYNKLVFLMGDIKSGRKTEIFILIIFAFFVVPFNHVDRASAKPTR